MRLLTNTSPGGGQSVSGNGQQCVQQIRCATAVACGVGQVVLISTDKAVRPTNVMGASKRLAELVVQAHAAGHQRPFVHGALWQCARFFRFGGAPVPPPDRCWGPITLTHPEIIRYFMTIPEAATLVLQSSVLAQAGCVPARYGRTVADQALAEQMVRLMVCLYVMPYPDGDIEIVCTGLRPGEKLYEELLIDAESQPTLHP